MTRRPVPWAIGLRDLGSYRNGTLRTVVVPPGVRGARRKLQIFVVRDAVGCDTCQSLSDIEPVSYPVVWRYLGDIEAGRRRLVCTPEGITVIDDTGVRSVLWSDLDDTAEPAAATDGQVDLFAAAAGLAPPVAVTHTGTQWAAARAIRSDTVKLGRQVRAVLLALDQYGQDGACCDALASVVGNLPNRIASRVGDLRRLGLAEDTGRKVKAQSGCSQTLWRLTAAGREIARQESDGAS